MSLLTLKNKKFALASEILPYNIKTLGARLHHAYLALDNSSQQINYTILLLRLLASAEAFFKTRGGSGVEKTCLVYIKVQPVMKLLLFTELQNLCLWQNYGASKFGVIALSQT